MKIFKTILWTSLFWILVIVGLWVASIFFPQEASTIIHPNVKHVIIELSSIDQAIENWEQEPVKIQEEIIPTEEEIIVNEEPEIEEENTPEEIDEEVINEKTTSSSIFPQTTQTSQTDEIAQLQNRVSELEMEYQTLVEELQTIFSTPVFTQLLTQAFSQTQDYEAASE